MKIIILFFAFIIVYGCNQDNVKNASINKEILSESVLCKKIWKKTFDEVKEYNLSNKELEYEWRKHRNKCFDSGVYHYRMSIILARQNKITEAGKLIKQRLISYKGPLSFELKMKDISLNMLHPLMKSKSNDNNKWQAIYDAYDSLIKKYNKSHSELQHGMALASYRTKNFKKAREHSIEALKRRLFTPTLNVLIKSNVLLGEYEAAVKNYDQAVRYDKAILKDPGFIMFVARAHAMVGKFELAKKMQGALSKVRFDAKSKSYFDETNRIILNKASM